MWATGLAALGAYCYFVSATRPFSVSADVTVAAGFVVVGAVGVRTLERRRRGDPDRRRGREPGALWPWAAVLGLFLAWELVTYFAGFGGHRRDWPTLSSLSDIAFRYQAAKAAAAAAWIALGLGLVSR